MFVSRFSTPSKEIAKKKFDRCLNFLYEEDLQGKVQKLSLLLSQTSLIYFGLYLRRIFLTPYLGYGKRVIKLMLWKAK